MGVQKPKSGQSGAALVEFAILAPLLLLLVVGIVEFGWLFAQFNEIRHSAQEGARWGAVSRPDLTGDSVMNAADLQARACGAANLPGPTTVDITAGFVIPGQDNKGDTATVTVTANVTSLTNAPLISSFLPATLKNTATFRLETDATWAGFGATSCP